ncbi:membrane protein [Streptomyces malachitofuscus]|nr:membrane protein [Streptomyces malachitofuscus]
MEQHRTRPAQHGPRRDPAPGPPGPSRTPRPSRSVKPPLPPQAGRTAEGGVARSARPDRPARAPQRRPAPPPAARRPPGPKLTGLGSGLFCGAVMLVLGLLTEALFGASQTVYGVLYLPVCVLTALWVREGDLFIAPVVVPIAFAVGMVPVADEGEGGAVDRLMGMVTGLATQAGWLYVGTLAACVIVLVRRVRRVRAINRRLARNRPRP